MPTPKGGYHNKIGTRVPGTTTVISRFKESGGLMQWAFKQGQSGAAYLYEEAEKAADIGTCAHAMVELHINGVSEDEIALYAQDTLIDSGMCDKARCAYGAYLSWADNFKVEIHSQEVLLVSEEYQFGGTPDAIGTIGGQTVLLDWKTSNAVYSDYLIQLAAYAHLWNENNPDDPITGGHHLLRFSKESGDFAHHFYPNLDDAWEQFKLFRAAYEIDKQLKKRAA